MKNFYWLWFGLILWTTRLALLCLLYFMDAPTGGSIVDRWYRFFPHTLVIEAGVAMTIACAGGVICSLVREKVRKVVGLFFVVLGILYIATAGIDDEVMRWMGQHLSISFVTTYALAASDMGLVGRVFFGGATHFLLTTFVALVGIVSLIFFFRKKYIAWTANRWSWIAISMTLILAIVGLTSKNWFAPSKMRWKRITPVSIHLMEEISYRLTATEKALDYEDGIELLGGNSKVEYPFWNVIDDSLKGSDSLESAQKYPDVILMVIETFRGWTADVRIPKSCEKLPNLCKLANQGLYYPNAHSVGYPSIEGFLGILTGLWSHPRATFLSDYPNTQMKALPDALRDAGYYRMVLTATEPSFDNLHPWFEKWFEFSEYKPENQHDVPIANRFKELYKNRPMDKPLFFDWMSTTSHVPFSLPDEYGPTPADPEEAYIRSLAYMDSAVGIVVDEVAKANRLDSTLFVVVGDHAFANNAQHSVSEYIGSTHDGYTWVPLIIVGPGIEKRIVPNPVSQVDIAPTILDYLNIHVDNNFVGTSLLSTAVTDSAITDSTVRFYGKVKYPPVFSFRMEDVAMITDSITYYANMQDSALYGAYRTRLVPDWDTTHLVEGFVTGEPANEKNLGDLTKLMRAAAKAWEYSINQNKIKPAKE